MIDLSNANAEATYVIVKVKKNWLRYYGFLEKKKIIVNRNDINGIICQVENARFALSPEVAQFILVEAKK